MWNLNISPRDVTRSDRRALGLTRRDVKRALRCESINRMARDIASKAESEAIEDSILDLIEAEGAAYQSTLAAYL
jgi:hypothetical protein